MKMRYFSLLLNIIISLKTALIKIP